MRCIIEWLLIWAPRTPKPHLAVVNGPEGNQHEVNQ